MENCRVAPPWMKRLLRRILHDVDAAGITLRQALAGKRIGIGILQGEAVGIGFLVCADLRKFRQLEILPPVGNVLCLVAGAFNVGDLAGGQAIVQRICHGDDAALAHAVEQQICLTVEQNGALDLVGPVVVMPQAAETCLNAADEDGCMPVALADEVAVDDRRVIRALPADTAGGKGVGFPMVMGNSIVVDHGVHIAASNEKAKPRLPQGGD